MSEIHLYRRTKEETKAYRKGFVDCFWQIARLHLLEKLDEDFTNRLVGFEEALIEEEIKETEYE